MDFFRGFCLLFMFTIHLAEFTGSPALKLISWHTYGFSDPAELFVFMSGLVFGLVYSRARRPEKLGAVMRKAVTRAGELYLANLLTFALLLALIPAISIALGWRNPWVEWWTIAPFDRIRRFLLFISMPGFFDILPLFVQLMLTMPLLRALYVRSAPAAWAVSGGIYLLSLAFPLTLLEGYHGFTGGLTLYFNPFAWQFVFFLGMALGLRRAAGAPPLPRPRWLFIAAAAYLFISMLIKLRLHLANYDIPGLGDGVQFERFFEPLIYKPGEFPLRLLHFLALVWVVTQLIPGQWHPIWTGWTSRVIRTMGRHSLTVFCLHIVLCYVLVLIMTNTSRGLPMQILMHFLGWGAMLAGGMGFAVQARRKRERLHAAHAAAHASHNPAPEGS